MNVSTQLLSPIKWLNSASKTKCILLIIFVGFIVYANSLFNGFIMDDSLQIVENKLMSSPKYILVTFVTSTFDAGSTVQGTYYRPIMMSVFIMVHTIFGNSAFFYHILLVVLHIANAILIFLFFKYFFPKLLSLFLSFIFLVHPINTETVNYVSNLQDILFMFFGLLALQIVVGKGESIKRTLLISLLIGLSLFSKETGLLFIILLVFFQMLFKNEDWKTFALYISMTVPFYLLLHITAVGWGVSGGFPMAQISLLERMLNTPRVIVYYLKTFIFPLRLAIGQTWIIENLDFQSVYAPLAALAVVAVIIVGLGYFLYKRVRTNFRFYLFFAVWFIIGLGFHSQILPLDQTVADRWFYFPLVGLLGMLGVVFRRLNFFDKRRMLFFYLALIMLLALALRTINRNNDWRDGLRIAQKDVRIASDSYLLTNYYGVELSKAGRLDEAQSQYKKSIELYSGWGISWNNLGSVLLKQAKKNNNRELVEMARYNFDKAIALMPISETPIENKAILMDQYNEPAKTKEYLEETLKKFPNNYKLWILLAVAENRLKDTAGAKTAAEKAVRLNPNCADCVKLLQSLNR